MNISLFLSGLFLTTFFVGRLIEKIRIPWIFSALFIGIFISLNNPFSHITNSDSFIFLANVGMYFLLFIIGFDLDIKEMLKQGTFVFKMTLGLIFMEAFFGSLLVHYVFNTPWPIAFLVASSFATVGEAVLLPILDEFKLIKTRFGQTLLGIGTLDDVFELITIIIASFLLGKTMGYSETAVSINSLIFVFLFGTPFLLFLFQKKRHTFQFKGVPSLFLFSLFMIFLFIGVGSFVESDSLGALLAGISLRAILNKEQSEFIEKEVRTISYGFLVPIFFFHVGSEIDLHYLLKAPLLIILVIGMTNTTKILTSYFLGKKELGSKKSILLGIGLSAKFSTSLVIITMLYNQNIISSELFSVLIGAMIASKFIIPVLFSFLIQKWSLAFKMVK